MNGTFYVFLCLETSTSSLH